MKNEFEKWIWQTRTQVLQQRNEVPPSVVYNPDELFFKIDTNTGWYQTIRSKSYFLYRECPQTKDHGKKLKEFNSEQSTL